LKTAQPNFEFATSPAFDLINSVHQPRSIRNVALIGFMGTGKSSVGHILASLLTFQMIDTDDCIEERSGKRITEIFATEGEARFREIEKSLVAELPRLNQTVIATGGGLAANSENLASLKSHALVVCLWASPERIFERIRFQSHRPLLNDPQPLERIRALLKQREPFYRQADILMNTDIRTPREVAHQIAIQFRLGSPPVQAKS
jgi:shikimate kinase